MKTLKIWGGGGMRMQKILGGGYSLFDCFLFFWGGEVVPFLGEGGGGHCTNL